MSENTSDLRYVQATRYWKLGIGRELGIDLFEKYLAAIPPVPADIFLSDKNFPMVVLVEPRVGLARLCKLGDIRFFDGDDETFEPFDARHAEFVQPTWIRAQSGWRNRNLAIATCRSTFKACELGLSALQGVCMYLQQENVVLEATEEDGGHLADLPGSLHCRERDRAPFLEVRSKQAWLSRRCVTEVYKYCGSASRKAETASVTLTT